MSEKPPPPPPLTVADNIGLDKFISSTTTFPTFQYERKFLSKKMNNHVLMNPKFIGSGIKFDHNSGIFRFKHHNNNNDDTMKIAATATATLPPATTTTNLPPPATATATATLPPAPVPATATEATATTVAKIAEIAATGETAATIATASATVIALSEYEDLTPEESRAILSQLQPLVTDDKVYTSVREVVDDANEAILEDQCHQLEDLGIIANSTDTDDDDMKQAATTTKPCHMGMRERMDLLQQMCEASDVPDKDHSHKTTAAIAAR